MTGQRREDRARRVVLLGAAAAVTPILAPAITLGVSWDAVGVAVTTIVSTFVAASIVAVLLYDVTRRIASEEARFDEERRRWRDEAHTDPLCGVANRRGADERIERLAATADPHDLWTVLALDIDHFKEVNDTHGHAVGDRVLATVASVLSEHIPPGAMVARWGGDEFVVFGSGHGDLPNGWAESLSDAITATPVRCREGELHIGVSFGLAQGPVSVPFADVLAVADDALLRAKSEMRRPVRLDPVRLDPVRLDPRPEPIRLEPASPEREVVTVAARSRLAWGAAAR